MSLKFLLIGIIVLWATLGSILASPAILVYLALQLLISGSFALAINNLDKKYLNNSTK